MRLSCFLPAFGAVLLSCNARACTACDSPAGHQLRAGLFDGHFVRTLITVAAPAPVLAAAALLMYVGMPDLSVAPFETEQERQLAPDFPEGC